MGSPTTATSATSSIVVTSALSAPMIGRAASSSSVSMRTPVSTASVWPSSVMVPAGSSTPYSSSVSTMSERTSPRSASASSSAVIVTRSPTAPNTETSRTPSSCVRSGTACASSASARSPGLRSLVTAIWMTGRSSIDPVSTCGSTSSGSCSRLTASCTRCSARAMSVPNWKLALTSEKPVLEVAFDSSSPGTA